ncbi:hypothetical protein C0J52_17458 [Blattella germanica]|nr:hypothetical protein C0J52_17458 [Blattella germanica]
MIAIDSRTSAFLQSRRARSSVTREGCFAQDFPNFPATQKKLPGSTSERRRTWLLISSPGVLEVRLQTQDFHRPQYKGSLDCFVKIVQKESVSGLYKGMSSPMAGVALVNAIVFGVYGNFQRRLPNPETPGSHFMAGAAAGFVQSFVCSPMELVKTRLQVLRTEGFRGIFRGLGTTICREIPGFGTYFYAYELMTRNSGEDGETAPPISTMHMLLAGGLSGTVSWVLTYPIDVVKSRLQADGAGGIYKYSGFVDCLKKSIQSEGYGVLTRGLNSTILRAFPTNAATFTVVTWIIRWANANNVDSNEGYILPEIIDVSHQENLYTIGSSTEDTVFGNKVFGLKDRTDLKYSYMSNIFNWRKVIMHEFIGGDTFSSFQFVPKSSQIYSLSNDEKCQAVEVSLKENSLQLHLTNLETEIDEFEANDESEKDSSQTHTPQDEKQPDTYQHKNDYYNSSVR